MSCFVVKDAVINQVVTWLRSQNSVSVYHKKLRDAYCLKEITPAEWADIAKAMWHLNVNVVCENYNDASEAGMIPASFTPRYELASTVQTYKSLRCYLYQVEDAQCCSILYTIMKEIADHMAAEIVCSLDEYKSAYWDTRSNGKRIH